MSRLIDADALIEHMRKAYNKRISDWDLISTVAVIGAEEDAKPIRHGHWEKSKDDNDRWRCSHCGYTYIGFNGADTTFAEMCSYCPNCGCKMDLDEVEE